MAVVPKGVEERTGGGTSKVIAADLLSGIPDPLEKRGGETRKKERIERIPKRNK